MTAFEELYKTNIKLLNNAFRNRGIKLSAEDILQSTYLCLYLHDEKVEDYPRNKLYMVFRHKLIDFFRRKLGVESTKLEEDNYGDAYSNEHLRVKDLSTEIDKQIGGKPKKYG